MSRFSKPISLQRVLLANAESQGHSTPQRRQRGPQWRGQVGQQRLMLPAACGQYLSQRGSPGLRHQQVGAPSREDNALSDCNPRYGTCVSEGHRVASVTKCCPSYHVTRPECDVSSSTAATRASESCNESHVGGG